MKKRLLPALLALVMVLGMLPLSAFAADAVTSDLQIVAAGYGATAADGKAQLDALTGTTHRDVVDKTMWVKFNKSLPAGENIGGYILGLATPGNQMFPIALTTPAEQYEGSESTVYYFSIDHTRGEDAQINGDPGSTAGNYSLSVYYYSREHVSDAFTEAGLNSLTEVSGATYTLALTATNDALDSKAPEHSVTIEAATNGTVATNATANKAELGDVVTITATPATHYELDTVTVKGADGAAITVEDNQFTMPNQNVTVSATFKQIGAEFGPITVVTEMYDKAIADLGTFQYSTSDTTVTVTGTANYINGWTEFNGADVAEQSGYYLPINIDAKVAGDVVVVGSGTKTIPVTGEDPTVQLVMLLNKLTDKAFKVTVNGVEYTVDCSGVSTPAAPTIEVEGTVADDKISAAPDATVVNQTIDAAKATSGIDTATFEVTPATSVSEIKGGSLTLPVASVEKAVTENVKVAVDVQDVGGVTLDKTALTDVKNTATAVGQSTVISVEVNAEEVETDELPETFEQAKRFEVEVKVNDVAVETWTTSSKITLKLNAPGLSTPQLYWVKDSGELVLVPSSYDKTTGVITATVNHLSTWMVADLKDELKSTITINYSGKDAADGLAANRYGTATVQVNGLSNADKAATGDTVTIVATPAAGYSVTSVVYTYTLNGREQKAAATKSGDNYTFRMPNADVTVNVYFGINDVPAGYHEYTAAEKAENDYLTNGYFCIRACDTGNGRVKASSWYVVQISQSNNPASGLALVTVVKSDASGNLIVPCNRAGYISVWEYKAGGDPDLTALDMDKVQNGQIIYVQPLNGMPEPPAAD